MAQEKQLWQLEFLPYVAKCTKFVNADLIAAGLSPLAPERELLSASRIFLAEIQSCIRKRSDFAFETTLSGRTYLKLIKQMQVDGWRVELVYLALPNMEVSRLRIAERVAHGGHNIALVDIERRFPRSLKNLLNEFSSLLDQCQCYLNANEEPQLIFEQQDSSRVIHNQEVFSLLEQEANRDQ